MLDFFRRNQKGFFIVITVVIIVSFSFFGTFQAAHGRDIEDKYAFTAIDGSNVYTSELNDMVTFLSQDSYDTQVLQNPFAGNVFNDGVLSRNVINTGLSDVIVKAYLQEISADQMQKLDREKRYKPYAHPKAPFLSASQVWNYYAPDIAKNLTKLSQIETAESMDAFKARVDLFSAERRFPPSYLKQFLRYQESMHKWLTPDANLPNYDLALFGYHSAQDWFGRRFVELTAQFIINAAHQAQSKGYKVTDEEVLGSLYRNCERAYKESAAANAYGVKTISEYFQEQLRHLSMDQTRLVKVWSQVLLFRRLFFDNADSVLVSPVSYEDFYKHLNEYVDIDLYQLPSQFTLASQSDLEKCLIYHTAVTSDKNSAQFARPELLLSVSAVKKNYPQLVEKPYHVQWKQINKEHLQTKVGVKTMWQWQTSDENWALLKTRYSELAKEPDATQEDRLKLLDALEPARRTMVDTYCRQEIVDAHPEWVKAALNEQQSHDEELFIRVEGGKLPFTGISDRQALMQLLDTVEQNSEDSALSSYSQDGVHYYDITVIDRQKPEAIISYEKAKGDGTLDELHKKNAVKFDAVFKELDATSEKLQVRYPTLIDWQDKTKARITAYLLPYVLEVKEHLRQAPEKEEMWVAVQSDETQALDAYKLKKSRERIVRKDAQSAVEPRALFSLPVAAQSEIECHDGKAPQFYTVVFTGHMPSTDQVNQKIRQVSEQLGNDVICLLGENIVELMQTKPCVPSKGEKAI